jgi:hypothetical protein
MGTADAADTTITAGRLPTVTGVVAV